MATGSNRKPGASRRPYVRFTRWRRAHFFRVLEETGHAQMAAEAAGVSLGCIYRLRRVEPGFTEKMRAAVAAADRRLEADGDEGRSQGTVPSALVIRRGRGGRLRVMAAGARWWTERHDPIFFAHLRATGSVAASARATGFTPKSAWNRRDRLPGFAKAMDEAREDVDMALEFELMAEAKLGDDAPADRDRTIRTLRFRQNRRRGFHSPRRPAPPPIEAVAERIERKVRAIHRHRKRKP
jgi:hypothetical protein